MFNTAEFIDYIKNYNNRIIKYDFPIGVNILNVCFCESSDLLASPRRENNF